jgi:hypothetical protein
MQKTPKSSDIEEWGDRKTGRQEGKPVKAFEEKGPNPTFSFP